MVCLFFYEYLGVCGWECGARDRLCRNIWLLLTWPIGSPVCVSYWLLITLFVYTPLEAWSLGYKTEVFGVLRGRSREARNEGQSTEREWSRDTRELNAYSLIDTSWVVAKCRRPSSVVVVVRRALQPLNISSPDRPWYRSRRPEPVATHDSIPANPESKPLLTHRELVTTTRDVFATELLPNCEYFFTYFIVFRTEYCRYVGTDC